jgi:hypothetical protein
MVTTINNRKINISEEMLSSLEVLKEAHKGGFATLQGYVSTSNRVVPEVANINFTSRYSNSNLIAKKKQALIDLKFDEVSFTSEKLLALSEVKQKEQFIACKTKMIESIEKTQNGVRTDAHRKAHDTFYVQVDNGVKIKLATHKVGKDTVLVLENGLPVAKNIVVMGLEVSRKVVAQGEYKVVNSGCKVLMDNAINKALKSKGVKTPKSFSLEDGKFDLLKISSEVIEG